MEFKALDGKEVIIDVDGKKYKRNAIQTHYITLGESYIDIIDKNQEYAIVSENTYNGIKIGDKIALNSVN